MVATIGPSALRVQLCPWYSTHKGQRIIPSLGIPLRVASDCCSLAYSLCWRNGVIS